ncbi:MULTISPECIES: nuclear transport factor 2 family protein [Actinomadura]|uniref:Nuclear transport factor 2 family protein n=1 Tax=Actinomadura yumaensis TaxID=111807 RepID=A0ABW2CD11_9ACTN|nr:ketosteroid isomerase [Actinomadura sp. J1-007]MWK38423.1 ketosteroid isomerase [Actinomadura sp. J1-007]
MIVQEGISPTRRELFELLEDVDTVNDFFARCADNVRWTLFGRHPLAGDYKSKEEFIPATIGKVRPLLSGGLHFRIRGLYGGDPITIVEMDGVATARDGVPYDPYYVWICRFNGETIVEVHAYVDSTVVNDILQRVPPAE